MGKLSMMERAVSSLDEAIRHTKDAADFTDEADFEEEVGAISTALGILQLSRSVIFEAIGDEVTGREAEKEHIEREAGHDHPETKKED
jgi:hypothetical protein